MRLVRIVKKGSKTILQRPYRKHEKILKTIKFTENANSCKAKAFH